MTLDALRFDATTLNLIIATVTVIALMLYALLAGADFGGGMWDLLAFGPRAERQRHAIADAIGPVWEANHVWLILVIVLLFSNRDCLTRLGIRLP